MTGKEIVQHIKNVLYSDNYYLELIEDELQQIEKDSEVLDLLKRYIKKELKWFMYNSGDIWYWYIDKTQSMKITDEEFKKLREWLSNDNTNYNE